MPEEFQYREPVFTHDMAENAWGISYWALSGLQRLEWVRATHKGITGLDLHAMYDHRRGFNAKSERCVCWCIKPKYDDIPTEITDTYEVEVDTYPVGLVTDKEKKEYQIRKGWALLYFKWDTMSLAPQRFNLLLAKLIALSDYHKIALAVLDTKDLYVNFNPVEWQKKYNAPYNVADLEEQKEVYTKWLTQSGFKRLYLYKNRNFVITPWYYRIPPTTEIAYGSSIQEYPNYKVHPLSVTGGLYYPPSWYAENYTEESEESTEDTEG